MNVLKNVTPAIPLLRAAEDAYSPKAGTPFTAPSMAHENPPARAITTKYQRCAQVLAKTHRLACERCALCDCERSGLIH